MSELDLSIIKQLKLTDEDITPTKVVTKLRMDSERSL